MATGQCRRPVSLVLLGRRIMPLATDRAAVSQEGLRTPAFIVVVYRTGTAGRRSCSPTATRTTWTRHSVSEPLRASTSPASRGLGQGLLRQEVGSNLHRILRPYAIRPYMPRPNAGTSTGDLPQCSSGPVGQLPCLVPASPRREEHTRNQPETGTQKRETGNHYATV